MTKQNAVVAVYATHVEAEEAVRELQRAGTDMESLSIVGKGTHTDEHVVGYYNTGDRMKYWGANGAVWGGFWGLLFGSAFFSIPGFGPLLLAGPVVAWVVGALESAALLGGASALGAGLYSIGIPKNSVVQYELAVRTDQYLLMVNGSESQVEKAREAIDNTTTVSVATHTKERAAALAL